MDKKERRFNTNLQPYILDKNFGAPLDLTAIHMPLKTAIGEEVVVPTPEQKFLFDTRGWVLIPSVLKGKRLAGCQEFAYQLQYEPQSIPEHERSPLGGALQYLVDAPHVVGFLNEFLAHPDLSSPTGYGFRCEDSSLFYREDGDGIFDPHNGAGMFRFPGDSHIYQCLPGRAFSGLTRVVWELEPVKYKQGGTLFSTGSHKGVFPAARALVESPDSQLWDTYECPAGSLLIFTEALMHASTVWKNAENPRLAVFNCYNTVNSKWADFHPHPLLWEQMPRQRQSLFRIACVAGNNWDGTYSH